MRWLQDFNLFFVGVVFVLGEHQRLSPDRQDVKVLSGQPMQRYKAIRIYMVHGLTHELKRKEKVCFSSTEEEHSDTLLASWRGAVDWTVVRRKPWRAAR